jgi:hypothetical protein
MISRILLNAALIVIIASGPATAGPSDIFYGQPWEFMETVGGVAIGTPSRTPPGTVFLPVICDVSGLTTITRKPTAINPALVVAGIDTKIDVRQILITVGTGLPSETTTSNCPGVDLGDIPAGEYQVFYYNTGQDKHLLGEVNVPSH